MNLPKCLIVDDLESNLEALSLLLQDEELEIHTANSGLKALELLLVNDYALSLLDVNMPVMDGFELAEIMRSTEKTKAIPIVFVTASAPSDVQRIFKGYEAGAVDFLHKPLYPKIVLGKVRVFLQLYNQRILLKETFEKTKEELEQKVQERTQALFEANQELEAFSYSLSHDLRAPLRSIGGFSKILLTLYQNKLDEKGRDYLSRIHDSSQKMGQLIDGMLILSNLERKEIHREEVNLSEISQEILEELQKEHPERRLIANISPDLKIEADAALMYATMENLLGNAWKYTSKKDVTEITIDSFEQDNHRIYFIKDNGAGFDMTYSKKLFEAFQRLHNAQDFPGSGIGLTTVKRILERHGGTIWAESEVGKGATFYFKI